MPSTEGSGGTARDTKRAWHRRVLAGAVLGGAVSAAWGLQAPQTPGRFDALLVPDPSAAAQPALRTVPEMEAGSSLVPGVAAQAAAWRAFRSGTGERWSVWLDARSGAPALVQGEGIPWIPGTGNRLAESAPFAAAPAPTLDTLGASLKGFVGENASLFAADASELVLDRTASAAVTPDLWLIVFSRQVGGVPVTGDGYVFYIGHGNLMAFGASRWSAVAASPVPSWSREAAFKALRSYLGMSTTEAPIVYDSGSLAFAPIETPGTEGLNFQGALGDGYRARLTWKFVFGLDGEAATWVGLVDAHTGGIIAFYDDTKYAQVKGGVFPSSNDGTCPSGCEQANTPMPFAGLTVNGGAVQANAFGKFTCSGGNAVTSLTGPYVAMQDVCGPISQSVACDNDLDLGIGSGTNCTVPAGASAGDTRAARSTFYHLNRAAEHVRGWLPALPWLNAAVNGQTNINLTCNAFYQSSSNTVQFYREGNGCRNTGEIASIMEHEWGHGLSFNDGGAAPGGSDEAYGDVTAAMLTRDSCIGRGLLLSGSACSGYGNACLTCTGVRDLDWDKHSAHAPTTVTNVASRCISTGAGPCSREHHCESLLVSEALWDLATRDLPASGLSTNTSWGLADRLWFLSRQGSGGNAYQCVAGSGGCPATSWFLQMKAVDDDDGNISNGTPHAAAIYAAFNRHQIACGLAADATNQNTTSCPALTTPGLTVTPGSGMAQLNWSSVPGAATYRVLRNDVGCTSSMTVTATPAGLTYTDTGLINGRPEYYTVQAVGSNSSCAGPVSSCIAVTPPGSADLDIQISDGPDPVVTQQTLTYDISLVSVGPAIASGVTVSEQVTAAAPFVSLFKPASWNCTTPAVGGTGNIVCTGPDLANGDGAVFHLIVRPRGCLGNGSIISSTATVSSLSDPVSSNNVASTTTTVTDSGTCDDGDPCTSSDFCSGGTCQPGTPVTCTAPNSCQAAECVAGVGCVNSNLPTGTSCENGNPCTVDYCQDGACVTGPVGPPDEVGDFLRILKVSGTADGYLYPYGAPGTSFSVYRGWRMFGQPWAYNQTCRFPMITDPVLVQEIPPVRDAFYYLVTRRESCGQSILGRNSAGAVIPNTSPCP